jgi:hypothetical protein
MSAVNPMGQKLSHTQMQTLRTNIASIPMYQVERKNCFEDLLEPAAERVAESCAL